jgi:hypothetical protein
MARKMKEVVDEYNSIMAANKTRFSSVAAGEKAIAKAKAGQAGVLATAIPARSAKALTKSKKAVGEKKNFKQRVTCDGVPYRGVKEAFEKLGLPAQKHGKFRLKLHAEGKAIFEHGDRSFNFVHIKQDGLAV